MSGLQGAVHLIEVFVNGVKEVGFRQVVLEFSKIGMDFFGKLVTLLHGSRLKFYIEVTLRCVVRYLVSLVLMAFYNSHDSSILLLVNLQRKAQFYIYQSGGQEVGNSVLASLIVFYPEVAGHVLIV